MRSGLQRRRLTPAERAAHAQYYKALSDTVTQLVESATRAQQLTWLLAAQMELGPGASKDAVKDRATRIVTDAVLEQRAHNGEITVIDRDADGRICAWVQREAAA